MMLQGLLSHLYCLNKQYHDISRLICIGLGENNHIIFDLTLVNWPVISSDDKQTITHSNKDIK